MKLCVPIPCFFKGVDFCEAIKTVASLGFDTIETYSWKSLDLKEVRRVLEGYGVKLISMCTSEFRMTTPEHRSLWLEGLKESCEAALEVGAEKLITQVGQDSGEDRDYQHKAIVDTLTASADILDSYGITVMPEPLNTYVNHPGYYLWSSKEGFDIIKEVNHPRVKLIYDIYHQQVMEGNIISSVVGNLDLIAHLHAASHPGRIDLQYGENDYKNIFSAIDKAGYCGYCGLEYRPIGDPIESLKEAKRIYGEKNNA